MSDSTAVASPRDYAALKDMLREIDTLVSTNETGDGNVDNSEFVASLMDNILSAESWDAVFDAQTVGMTAGKDFADIPFYVVSSKDVTWQRSSRTNIDQGGFPFFAIIRAYKYENDEEVTLNCGGKTFVATLWRLQQLGYFDNQPQEYRPLVIRAVRTTDDNAYLQVFPYRVITKK